MAQKEVKHYTNSQIEAAIDEYVHNERNRMILKRRYIDGIHIEPLAEEFDLSTKQIKNIIKKDGDYVFLHL